MKAPAPTPGWSKGWRLAPWLLALAASPPFNVSAHSPADVLAALKIAGEARKGISLLVTRGLSRKARVRVRTSRGRQHAPPGRFARAFVRTVTT